MFKPKQPDAASAAKEYDIGYQFNYLQAEPSNQMQLQAAKDYGTGAASSELPS